jgi:hypothetical protein
LKTSTSNCPRTEISKLLAECWTNNPKYCLNRDLNPHKSRSQNIVIYLLLESRSWVTWSLDPGSRPQFGTQTNMIWNSTLRNPDPQSYILLQKRGLEEHQHVNSTRTEILKLLAMWWLLNQSKVVYESKSWIRDLESPTPPLPPTLLKIEVSKVSTLLLESRSRITWSLDSSRDLNSGLELLRTLLLLPLVAPLRTLLSLLLLLLINRGFLLHAFCVCYNSQNKMLNLFHKNSATDFCMISGKSYWSSNLNLFTKLGLQTHVAEEFRLAWSNGRKINHCDHGVKTKLQHSCK